MVQTKMGINPCAEIYLGKFGECSISNDMMPLYLKISESKVDGERWVTCYIAPEIMYWLKSLQSDLWVDHKKSHWQIVVDMRESLYTMMVLRWS